MRVKSLKYSELDIAIGGRETCCFLTFHRDITAASPLCLFGDQIMRVLLEKNNGLGARPPLREH